MQRRLSDIKRQNLQTVLGPHLECPHCHIVDTDMERITVGTPCNTCGKPSPGGRMLYSLRVLDLLEMIQATFHAPIPVEPHLPGYDTAHRETSAIASICTLEEVLMTHFLERFGRARGLAPDEIDKALGQHRTFSKRQTGLLPKWTGLQWKELVALEASTTAPGFTSMNETMSEARRKRNTLAHEGAVYGLVDREFVAACIDGLPLLMAFYAALHNRYARPLLLERKAMLTG